MACTEAVEEVIIDHYKIKQNTLKEKDNYLEKITRKFADDEKEHMHQAKNHDTGDDVFHKAFKLGVKSLSNLLLNYLKKI